MNIKELNSTQNNFTDKNLIRIYTQFGDLLEELRKRKLSANIENLVNDSVEEINSSNISERQLYKFIKQKQTIIINKLEKELKISTKKHYRNFWMLFGFTAFGMPIGVSIGLIVGNIGLLGLGLPIGMAIGFIVGSFLDKKALKDGRQLNIEIKI